MILRLSELMKEIYSERGADGLKRALSLLEQHLRYQNGKNSLPRLEKVYKNFSEII